MRKFSMVIAVAMIGSVLPGACAPQAQQPVQTLVITKMVAGTPHIQYVVVTATPAPEVAKPVGSVLINGAGATFPLPVYTEWIFAYQYIDPSVTLNYQGIGSGGGKKGIIDGTIDFAGSDSVLKDEEYARGKDLQMYPMLAGAVVPIYNVEGVTQALTLDSKTLVGIYDAKITKWNEAAIVALNPGIMLPDANITVVHRSDGSGTTEMFTNALASFSEDWMNGPGAGSAVEWPVDKAGNGIGGKGNQGVAAVVQNTPNSIGYVELSYAIANKIPYAQMVNAAGKTVKADEKNLASAMADFLTFSDKMTNMIVNGSGADSWPIAGYTYLILHTTSMQDCVKAQKIVDFINWALTDPGAAKRAGELGYAVMPDAVRSQVLSLLGKVTCNGKQVVVGK